MKTKRGNTYNLVRKNKIANGMMRNYEDQKKTRWQKVYENGEFVGERDFRRNTTPDVNTLLVCGTLDELRSGNTYLLKRRIVAHPIEPGYTKTVFELNEHGKAKLKRMRIKKIAIQLIH